MNQLTTIRPELLTLSADQFCALKPYLAVFGGTVLMIVFSVFRSLKPKWPVFFLGLLTAILGGGFAFSLIQEGVSTPLFNGAMVSDGFSNFFNLLFLASAALTCLASMRYLDREGLQYPEYYVLVMFSALGMMLMVSALDLISLFVALEIMSLAVYILVGYRRADRRSNEAAMKYYILGSAASAVLLYGTALLYGSTGSTGIGAVATYLTAHPQGVPPTFILGIWLVITGFLFKVAAVPFHMWMPDVYEGAPTPVTGFMTTGLKAAAFAAFVRVFFHMGFGSGLTEAVREHVHHLLWGVAVLTMVVGNVVALTQTNLKRMLAYSSIAHTGYLAVGILAASRSEQGFAPVLVYLVAYAAMNLGAFVVLTVIGTREDAGLNLHDVSGLARRHPWLAFSLGVFMFSMAGVPPTAGFAAKYLLFYSAVQAGEIPLVIISVLCSAISVYYYLRVLVYVYMREPDGSPADTRTPVWSLVALAAMVVMTLQIGMMPAKIVSAARKAVSSL